MNIYLIIRTDEWGYDEYDSCIVIENSRLNAIKEACELGFDERFIECNRIGIADVDQERGIILSSFNAG
jgi:hypothetical protein